jgi:anaphase-promoting complex subunit 3
MSPSAGIAASQLRQLIYYHLDNDMLDNANFLADRLHALEPKNPDSAHLLALTYYRTRRFRAAYDTSEKHGKTGRHLGCAYIFAKACLELRRYTEGVGALEKAKTAWAGTSDWSKHSETSRHHTPDAAAVLTLLARLWRDYGDLRKAGDYYIEAHKMNPFVWDAFEGLCKVGADLKVEFMFKPPREGSAAAEDANGTHIYVDEDSRRPLAPQPSLAPNNVFHAMDDPFVVTKEELEDAQNQTKARPVIGTGLRPALSDWETPNANLALPEDDVFMADNDVFMAPAAPSRRVRPGQFETSERPRVPTLRAHTTLQEPVDDLQQAPAKVNGGGQKRTITGAPPSSLTDSGQPRRSNRLFTQTTSTRTTRSAIDSNTSTITRPDRTTRAAKTATGAKGRSGVVGRVVSGNRKILPPDEKEKDREKRTTSRTGERNTSHVSSVSSTALSHSSVGPSEAELLAEKQAMSGLLDNFRHLAVGYHAAARFDLETAVQAFRTIPSAQRETPWVLAQLGKAYYEQSDYKQAEDCFARLTKLQPSRIEDMEIYSTVLWHLKKEFPLAFLSRLLRDHHFDAPQTWVAVGNAFSLAREHDQALAAFKRATQLDENFAYAWTLMGHEYIVNEAFDSALAAFRKTISIDKRNYQGYYGLGKCLERMGKLESAEHHYRVAAGINGSNSVLLVCIGNVLERLRNKKGALANYAKALEKAPDSALARFKKARVLMHMKYYGEALKELEVLIEQAPDEANVWFLMGKCCKGMQDRAGALRALTTALNLDVKVRSCLPRL